MATNRIKRFSAIDRIFHLSLMLTFITQAATGFGRLYYATTWGQNLCRLLGGYEACMTLHVRVGMLMILGFVLHSFHMLLRIDWKNPMVSLFGPDSIVPNLQDLKNLKERILWTVGLGKAPGFDRWAYFEKFDYWAVYWGIPLLAITGLMAIYPMATCRILPGWSLNISALLHRAEAILAVTYVFIVHFFVGHLRPTSFPMNEAMFSGSVPEEEIKEEKPAWMERLRQEDRQKRVRTAPPAPWYRVLYLVFGFAVLSTGIYLLVNGILNGRMIQLH